MTVFRLGAFYRDRLNLNGDQMNLGVLAKRLIWRGHEVEVVDLTAQNTAQAVAAGLDFVLVGHGSAAAWTSILREKADLRAALTQIINSQIPLLAVSSGFEVLSDLELISIKYQRVARVSKFAVVPSDQGELLGYVNSETTLPVFARFGEVIGTLLHGPLLAKNVPIADHMIDSMIARKSAETIRGIQGSTKNVHSSRIDQILVEVWKLEADLANE